MIRNVQAAAAAVVDSCERVDDGYLVGAVEMGWLADAIEDEPVTRNPLPYRVTWS